MDHIKERQRCFQILELSPGASQDDIKKAFKTLALRYHPDKNTDPGATIKFQEILFAHKYLMRGHDYLLQSQHDNEDLFAEMLTRMFPWLNTTFLGRHWQEFFVDDDSDDSDFNSSEQINYRQSNTSQRDFFLNQQRPSPAHSFSYSFHERTQPRPQSASQSFNYRQFTNSSRTNDSNFKSNIPNTQHQWPRSAKKQNKEERNARREDEKGSVKTDETDKSQANRKTSPQCKQEDSKPKASKSPAPKEESQSSPRENAKAEEQVNKKSKKQIPKEEKQKDKAKDEEQVNKKSKKQILKEEKQKDKEIAKIRQKLEQDEEKKRQKSQERREAQEKSERAEREAKEREKKRLQEEERLRIETELVKKKAEQKQKAKKEAEQKRINKLSTDFDNNEFLDKEGGFQSKNPNILNIIKMENSQDVPDKESDHIEEINGIPVTELIQMQSMNFQDKEHVTDRQKQANQPSTGRHRRHRSRSRRGRTNRQNMAEFNQHPRSQSNDFFRYPPGQLYSQVNGHPMQQGRQADHPPGQSVNQAPLRFLATSTASHLRFPLTVPPPNISQPPPRIPGTNISRPPPPIPGNISFQPRGRLQNVNH